MAMVLRPNTLDDLGLVAALRKYAADFQAKNGIQVDLQVGEAARRRFPPDVETAAYRITQEALANVVRHAAARIVSIVVNFQDPLFTLIVEDDGVGFDTEESSRRAPDQKLGLFGMLERASLVGGRLVIESTPGQGTSVFLEVPVKPKPGVKNE
jgi:signal transduction histidine kinase